MTTAKRTTKTKAPAKKTAGAADQAEEGTEVVVVDKGPSGEKAGLPAYLQGFDGATGAENIGMDDVTVPRICLGQGMSPQVKDGECDIEDGDIFLNLGDMLLAKKDEPLDFVIIAEPTTEYMLWDDRKGENRGLLARASRVRQPDGSFLHLWDKPGQTFTVKVGGMVKVDYTLGESVEEDGLGARGTANPDDPEDNREAATLHRNFLVYLPKFGIVAAFSLAKTWGSPPAKDLKGLIKFGVMKGGRKVPLWARVFQTYAYHKPSKSDATVTYTTLKIKEHLKPGDFTAEFGLAADEVASVTGGFWKQYVESGFTVDQSDDEGSGGDAASGDGKF